MFEAAVSELHQLTVGGMSRHALADCVDDLRRLKGAAAALEMRLVCEIDRLGDAGLDGAGVMRSAGRMSSRTAAVVAKTATQLESMPRATEALADGRITAEHANVLAAAAETLDDPELIEESLVRTAEQSPADLFDKRSREWVDQQRRPRDGEDEQVLLRTRRSARRWTSKTDNMGRWLVELDPVAFDDVTKKILAREHELWLDDGGREGAPEEVRTSEQRLADAIVSLLTEERVANSASRRHPKHHLGVVFDASRMRVDDPAGFASIVDGQALPQSVLEYLACDAAISPMIFDGPGKPIWVGRDHRTATVEQWKALIARDRGCVGCGAEVARCEAHHVIAWRPGGPTDIDNLVLLCTRCHHDIHDRQMTLARSDAGSWRVVARGHPPPGSVEEAGPPDRASPARRAA